MTFYGANVDELDELARQLSAAAERLNGVRVDVRRVVHASPWDGDDASRFRIDFDGRVGPSITEAAALLEQTANTVKSNADDQRRASGDLLARTGAAGDGFPLSRTEIAGFSETARRLATLDRAIDALGLFVDMPVELEAFLLAEDIHATASVFSEQGASPEFVQHLISHGLDAAGKKFKWVGPVVFGIHTANDALDVSGLYGRLTDNIAADRVANPQFYPAITPGHYDSSWRGFFNQIEDVSIYVQKGTTGHVLR